MTQTEPNNRSVASHEPAELRLRVEDIIDRCAPELPLKYMLFSSYAFVGLAVPLFAISLVLGILDGPWARVLWFFAALAGGLSVGTIVAVRRFVAELQRAFLERTDGPEG